MRKDYIVLYCIEWCVEPRKVISNANCEVPFSRENTVDC